MSSIVRNRCRYLATILLKLPVSVVKRADLTGLQPTGDAVKVKSVLSTLVSSYSYSEDILDLRYRFPMQRYILRWWQKLGLLDIRCLKLSDSNSKVRRNTYRDP